VNVKFFFDDFFDTSFFIGKLHGIRSHFKTPSEARWLRCRMRLWGSELFYGHLMAGPTAAVPSYLASPTGGTSVSTAIAQGPSLKPINRHEPILVDYVFALRGYNADHTRIFSIG
jgi:hypothetical protein